MTFTILTVCTGNICRSPVAEFGLVAGLVGQPVRVHSAGTGALVGNSVPDPAQRLSRNHGLDVSSHRARQIDNGLIREADLILALARDHRREVVIAAPAATRKTFTLREFARLAGPIEAALPDALAKAGARSAEDGMRVAVTLAASLRGTVAPPHAPDDFDVVDPYRRSNDVYEASFDQMLPALAGAAAILKAAASAAM